MISGAIISPDEAYRYLLWRIWGSGRRFCMFIMLNPSTADASINDPTIRRCIDFAKRWGFDGLIVGNAFAYRATKPTALRTVADPIGPLNQFFLALAVASSEKIVVAWGSDKAVAGRDNQLLSTFKDVETFALGETGEGFPRHPLYVKSDAELISYRLRFPA